jgi:hypothetical protein
MPFVVWTAISTGLVSLMFAPWPKGTTKKDQDERNDREGDEGGSRGTRK